MKLVGLFLFIFPLLPSSILAAIVIRGQRREHGYVKQSAVIAIIIAYVVPIIVHGIAFFVLARDCGWFCGIYFLLIVGIVTISVPISYMIGSVVGSVVEDYKKGVKLWQAQSLIRLIFIVSFISIIVYVIFPIDPPVAVYGRLIDQYGNPVPGATVNYTIKHTALGYRTFSDYTNKDGTFSTDHHNGLKLKINYFEKSGYDFLVRRNRASKMDLPFRHRNYADFGTTNNAKGTDLRWRRMSNYSEQLTREPIVFHAWKKGDTATLILDTKSMGFSANNGYQEFKLPATKGAVKIRFEADWKEGQPDRDKWAVDIMVSDGGILETDDQFLYEAPVNGYQAKWSYRCTGLDPSGRTPSCMYNLNRSYYIKAHNGQIFGALMVRFRPFRGNDNKFYTDIAYWINPSKSRNLLNDKSN